MLAFSDNRRATKGRLVAIAAGDLGRLSKGLSAARERFEMSPSAAVVSCYEAGRDGFWSHRYLESIAVDSIVVDAAEHRTPTTTCSSCFSRRCGVWTATTPC